MSDIISIQGGTIANSNGNTLENFVANILTAKNYTLLEGSLFTAALNGKQAIYSKQVYVGESIYDTPLRSDFYIYHPDKWKDGLIIECKWQQSGGSVDEKYPFLVLNIKEKFPAKTIVVLDGNGYKPGAKQWLERQKDSKLLHVLSMTEFLVLCNQGFL